MKKNIVYQTDRLAHYFTQQRISWSQFYESEREIISQLNLSQNHTILDIGCGCSGLGLVLRDQFGVENYTGVEINSLAAESARMINTSAQILCGDFLELRQNTLRDKHFNVVFSLSCFDWNIQFSEMLSAAWEHVLPKGALVATFRLVDGEGCDDMKRSYQYINFEGEKKGECAAYVVLSAKNLMRKLVRFNPSSISACGYFGTPSSSAVTPYERLCFSAFSITKRDDGDQVPIKVSLNLPEEIKTIMESLV